MKNFLSIVMMVTICGISTIFAEQKNIAEVNASSSSYYDDITETCGDALMGELHDLLITNHFNYNNYGDVGSGEMQLEADKDFAISGNIIDIYTQNSLNGDWDGGNTYNREHIWPKNLSGGLYKSVSNSTRGAGADILSIRPCIPNINSSRSDSKYGVVSHSYAKYFDDVLYGYSANSVFEPIDEVKGDVARIVMYTYTHYSENVGKRKNDYVGNLVITNLMDCNSEKEAFELLLDWHELDPVNDLEIYRNDYAEGVTGARNPYVDNPSYFEAVLKEPDPVFPTSITINNVQQNMNKGDSLQLTYSILPSNAKNNVSWSSSNQDIISISSDGVITALKPGKSTISVSSVDVVSVYDSVQITVLESSSSSSDSSSTSENSSSSGDSDNSNISNGMIIGISVGGGVALIGTIAGIVISILKKRNKI